MFTHYRRMSFLAAAVIVPTFSLNVLTENGQKSLLHT